MTSIIARNDAKFVDTFRYGVMHGDLKRLEMCRVALQAFVREPMLASRKRVQALMKVQALASVSTDFAKLVSDAFNVTIAETAFDLGYERAFRGVPLGAQQDTWDIYDVINGLTFKQVPEGGRIELEGMKGSLVTAHVDYYGGALGWTDKMIRYRKVAAMVDIASTFRNRFWSNKADNHYLLLATAAALNVTPWQGAVADGQLRRDIQTLNEAAFRLTNRCKNKSYGDTAAVQLVLYYNPRNKDRVLAALAATTANMAAAQGVAVQVNWNLMPVPTYNSSVIVNRPILVLPGNKLQMAEDMPPTTFNAPKDPLTLNELQSVWSIYGAVVADTDQCEELRLS